MPATHTFLANYPEELQTPLHSLQHIFTCRRFRPQNATWIKLKSSSWASIRTLPLSSLSQWVAPSSSHCTSRKPEGQPLFRHSPSQPISGPVSGPIPQSRPTLTQHNAIPLVRPFLVSVTASCWSHGPSFIAFYLIYSRSIYGESLLPVGRKISKFGITASVSTSNRFVILISYNVIQKLFTFHF